MRRPSSAALRAAPNPAAVGWRWRQRLAAGGAPPAPQTPGDDRVQRLEAVLFLAREPLTLGRLATLASLADAGEVKALVRRLQQAYDTAGSALEIQQVAGGYQLLTRAKLAPWLNRLTDREADPVLTPPALETLAVAAYLQPVVRAEVEAIRGVQCGELLRQLIDKDLLRIVGRSRELGRPLLYGTTRRFLQRFGLRDLSDLPAADRLRRQSPTSN
ncbi:hypothetical protein Pla175_52160 [Pirellulimonas nuda]|uniref:Segregation and condensation protein B n=1 Tax=Pirellulimonas nuda TaxID=2528009 RepID=A0A518DJX9_9BACT|nr:SMC-Scp complex subunit ScpB [Pirellulimonas nuda]QDU91785.1 hypothetical protein Pla175_52160 [Pirellulimonas nuda]